MTAADMTAARHGVWVGIDLGTQSVRVMAVGADGTVLGTGVRPLTSRRDGPRQEQDPEDWWTAVAAASCEALRDVPPGAVQAVAVDATSGTVLLTDTGGSPLTPALMYDDTRATHEVQRVNDVGADVWAQLGYQRMQPAWALPKLLWLLDHHPELRVAASAGRARLAHQSDFVTRRLVGTDVATDLSSALKTGAHLLDEAWPTEVMAQLGVPAAMLPTLVRSGTPLGSVSAEAAGITGMPAGTVVIAGMTDGCAAQLGAGALRTGDWNSVLGTTLVLKGVTDELVYDPLGIVYSHRATDGGWLPGGASSTGAAFITREFADRDLDALAVAARRHEPASAVTYPLAGRGERFPFVAPDAQGFSLGAYVDDGDRYAGVLQGVAYIERLCFDYLDLLGAPTGGDLVLTGGATRSRYWCQLRADVLKRPVLLRDNAEPALGMAVLAASADRPTSEAAAAMVRPGTTLEPGTGSSGRFDDAYLTLVDSLEQRGWLPSAIADHARTKTRR